MSSVDSEKLKRSIGERLRQVRGPDRLKDFADEFNETPSKVSNYESGKHFPSVQLMTSLYQKKNINLHWLLTGDGEMYVKPLVEKHPAPTIQMLLQEIRGWEELAPALTDLLRNMKEDTRVQYRTAEALQQLRTVVAEQKKKYLRKG